jgi:hypothetical protein
MTKWVLMQVRIFLFLLTTRLPFHGSPYQLQLYVRVFEAKAVRESGTNTELK